MWVFKIGLVVEFIETWFLRSKVLGNFVFVFRSGFILGASFGKLSFHLVSESLNQFCFGRSKLAFGYLAFGQVVFFGSCQKISCV